MKKLSLLLGLLLVSSLSNAAYTEWARHAVQYVDSSGDPASGATLCFFASGTSTPQAVYSSDAGAGSTTSIALDSSGYPTSYDIIWLDSTLTYKIHLIASGGSCATGTQLWAGDPIVPEGQGNSALVGNLSLSDAGSVERTLTIYNTNGGSQTSVNASTADTTLYKTNGSGAASDTVWTYDYSDGSFDIYGNNTLVLQVESTGIVVPAAGPHSFGGANAGARFTTQGAFTSPGLGSAFGFISFGAITGASGDETRLAGSQFSNTITTQGATETIPLVGQVVIIEPDITVGSGDTVTNSASLYIANAATEATNNYALFVDAGATRLDGSLAVQGASSVFSKADPSPNGAAESTGDDGIFGSTGTANTGITLFGTTLNTIYFGDAGDSNAGQYEFSHSGNTHIWKVSGSTVFSLDSDSYDASDDNGPSLLNIDPTSTTPSLIPDKSDPDTGISGNGSNELYLTAGGTKVAEIVSARITIEKDLAVVGALQLGVDAATISSSVLTVTKAYHTVSSEGGSGVADTMTSISGGIAGDVLILRSSDTTSDITVSEAGGTLQLGAATRVLSHIYDYIVLICVDGTNWAELNFADNET